MKKTDQFYFIASEVQRLRHLTERMQQLNSRAGALLRRSVSVRNASRSHSVADSIEAVARQMISIQKRRYDMLAYATEPHYSELVAHFGVRCEACEDLHRQRLDKGDDFVVLAAWEACPQPELEPLLDFADLLEELLMSTFNSRFGSRRASLIRALSLLKSALLKQKAPLPRFRPNSFYPQPKIVVLCKRFECTRCGKPMKWERAFEDPRYVRALRRSQARKAEQKALSEQQTSDTVEKEAK